LPDEQPSRRFCRSNNRLEDSAGRTAVYEILSVEQPSRRLCRAESPLGESAERTSV